MHRLSRHDRRPLPPARRTAAPFAAQKSSARHALGLALLLAAPLAAAAPTGGNVSAGAGAIASNGATTTITQSSDKLVINWNGFGIAAGETVNFIQPGANAIALNRVLGNNASEIYGRLNANGKVFLINPNGILFGAGASVNVGGLVASTLDLADSDFLAGRYRFSGKDGAVTNRGSIVAAEGGYVALLGGQVSNEGSISARLGAVALGAGKNIVLDLAGDGLLGITVDQGALHALARNKQLIQADGGVVWLTAKAADSLVQAVVNNDGVIEAHTAASRQGRIYLLGDMSNGMVQVNGALDASAHDAGNGGFIETSAAAVKIGDSVRIDTSAAHGATGTWLVDPTDFTVAASGGDISGAALSASLASSNVVLQSSSGGAAGHGDLVVADALAWSSDNTLTLTAANDVKVKADIRASGDHAGLVINPNTGNGGDAASGVGMLQIDGAAITLAGNNPSLSIGGKSYTVIKDLAALQAINSSLDNVTTRYYALGQDIDASATASWNGGLGFVPLGAVGAEYRGIFEGLGHTIGNLTINRPGTDNVGLIGYMSGWSTLRDVGLANANIVGATATGGLVGRSYGDLYNAWVSGSVRGYDGVGGAVGQNYASTRHVYTTAAVSGTYTVGGVAGASSGSVIDSYASGNVSGEQFVGGLIGATSGIVTNATATGDVSGNAYVGGLTGFNVGGSILTDTYASGRVSATLAYGGALSGFNGTDAHIVASFWLASRGVGLGANDGVVDAYTRGLGESEARLAATYAAAGWDIGSTAGSGAGASAWRIYEGDSMPLLRSYLKPITVDALAANRDYDGSTGGSAGYAANGAALLGQLRYTSASADVGHYDTAGGTLVLGGLYSAQGGYDIRYGTGSLNITPAALVVTANDASATAGRPYAGGNGVSYAGFVAGDGAAMLGGTLAYGGDAQGASAAGDYRISASGLTARNYRIRYVDGTLSLRDAPAATAASAGDSPTLAGQDKAAIALLPHGGDGLEHSGELLLRIVNGGIRLPQGIAEIF